MYMALKHGRIIPFFCPTPSPLQGSRRTACHALVNMAACSLRDMRGALPVALGSA